LDPVGHEAIRPDSDGTFAGELAQPADVQQVIFRIFEDNLPEIAHLKDIMQVAGDDDPLNPGQFMSPLSRIGKADQKGRLPPLESKAPIASSLSWPAWLVKSSSKKRERTKQRASAQCQQKK
jgi:hypothetical protein